MTDSREADLKIIDSLFERDDLYTARCIYARLANFGYFLRAAPRCDAEIVERCAKVAESFQRSHRDFSVALDIAKAIRALTVSAAQGDAESDQPFVEMLWKWFEDRGADLRPERQTGLTANDFRTMLDEHEAALGGTHD